MPAIVNDRFKGQLLFNLFEIIPKFKLYGCWVPIKWNIYDLWIGSRSDNLSYRITITVDFYHSYTKHLGAINFWDFILKATQEEVDLATIAYKLEGLHEYY